MAAPIPAELRTLIDACLKRGNRPVPLPHCAICARYAKVNLAFEGILAFLDALPAADASALTELVESELSSLPSGYRQQPVTVADFAALLDAPSWRLVRSLVIDLYGEEIARHFADPRLANVEEITLLGGAYGGPDITPEYLRALVESPALVNVQKFTLHSGDVDAEGRSIFWSSAFARRLEEIDGFPYFGEETAGPLEARVLHGLSVYQTEGEPQSFALPGPQIAPRLESLSLCAGGMANDSVLAALETEAESLGRLKTLAIAFFRLTPEQIQRLSALPLPPHASVAWAPEHGRGDTFTLDCDMLTVFRADKNDGALFGESDCFTTYGNSLFELDVLGSLSRSLRELKVIVPPDRAIDELAAALERFERLEELTVVYPITFDQAMQLAASPAIGRLKKLHLVLSLSIGRSTTPYKQERAEQYFTAISEEDVCRLISGTAFRGIDHLTIADATLEIARSRDEFQHVVLGSPEAARAFARVDPALPIELLRIEAALGADDLAALRRANVFARVYHFCLHACLPDGAMAALTADPGLRHVQALSLCCFHNLSETAFEKFVNCPLWEQVREFDFSTNVAGAAEIVARSAILPRLVSVGCMDYPRRGLISEGIRLPLLRRIDESLTMTFFTDARQARRLLAAGPSTPLKARLEEFIRRTYSPENHRTLEQIIADLQDLDPRKQSFDERERRMADGAIALLAKVFEGQPVPDKTAFADLNPAQQDALRLLEEVGRNWWGVGDVMRRPMASYGFDFHEERFKKFLSGEIASQ
jgi:hypothetical protein